MSDDSTEGPGLSRIETVDGVVLEAERLAQLAVTSFSNASNG